MEFPSIIFGAWIDLAQDRDRWVLHFYTKLRGSIQWGINKRTRNSQLPKTMLRTIYELNTVVI
jgi:hypothetical protein